MKPVEIFISCKIITPMLASGANQKQFEIRATEIKSALRFWWRAFHHYNSSRELYQKESELFGNTGQAAAFKLFVEQEKKHIKTYDPGTPHGWGEGIQYCLYPVNHQSGTIKSGRYGRQLAKPTESGKSAFNMHFMFRKDSEESIETYTTKVEDLLCALWLLVNLGGIGARTRRGAGCIEITKLKPEIDENMDIDIQLLNDLFNYRQYESPEDFIKTGIQIIQNRWLDPNKADYEIPEYTAFRPGVSQIHVFSEPNTGEGTCAMQAMDAVGLGMKRFRYINPYNEAKEMHEAINGGQKPTFKILEKSQMGLPIIYNFRDRNRFDTGGAPQRGNQYETKNVRRASPLLISCHCFNGIPYAVLCMLPSPILPEGKQIKLEAKNFPRNDFWIDPPSPAQFDYMENLICHGSQDRYPISQNFDQAIQVI
jgi:CRISPR-associated protein Cmr1